jgi:nucleolar protein 56
MKLICDYVIHSRNNFIKRNDRRTINHREMATHILFESASGYAIFEVKLREEIAAMTEAVQKSIEDLGKFKKMVTLLSFSPFKSAAHALENANDVSEGA